MNPTWKDIESVGLFDDVPDTVRRLTRTIERLSMSRFFCSGPIQPPYHRDEVDSWMVWASIAALPSPANQDPIHQDMLELGLSNEWNSSTAKKGIYSDPLLATLLEIRNFGVHAEVKKNRRQDFIAHHNGKDVNLGHSVYILPVDFSELSRNRNIQTGISSVDQNMIAWFNGQVDSWPAHCIIGEARRRLIVILDDFLKTHTAPRQ